MSKTTFLQKLSHAKTSWATVKGCLMSSRVHHSSHQTSAELLCNCKDCSLCPASNACLPPICLSRSGSLRTFRDSGNSLPTSPCHTSCVKTTQHRFSSRLKSASSKLERSRWTQMTCCHPTTEGTATFLHLL
jgi:hypothetical protein